MQSQQRIPLIIILILTCLSGCSTLKNTPAARSYHQTKCNYNIAFNAMNSYREGMKAINEAQNDDYTQQIEMYPISLEANRSLATAQMDVVILKCRKAIKNHSITRKPKLDTGRKKDEKYMYFYNQEEYVQGVKDAWILLGQAEVHKGDFLAAAATFNYVQRHFPSDRIIACRARIWLARAYSEAGWSYEAEQAFNAIKPDAVPRQATQEYTATKALLLIRSGRPSEAIPFLKLAVDNEHERYTKARWCFLLGQLCFNDGRMAEAAVYLRQAAQRSQNYQLEFNARLLLLQAEGQKWRANIKSLDKMAKAYNNRDYLDQIYNAKGNIYLAHGDTARALTALKTGVEKSTRAGAEKGALLIRLGDLYFTKQQYVDAQPCYAEAVNLIDATHPDYRRVSRLSQTLDNLVQYKTTVELQDSLQMLATLPEQQQRRIVDKIIADLIAQEQADSAAEVEQQEKGFQESIRPDMNLARGSQEWYFYNSKLVERGAQLFRQKFGSRMLEDDWQRSNKTASSFAANGDEPKDESRADDPEEKPDAKGEKQGEKQGDGNPAHDPEYYLSQIPQTDEQIAASNAQIATALYSMARLYDEQLAEYELALTTHEEYQGRFPNDTMNLESLYDCYRIGQRLEYEETTAQFRDEIISRYPGSTYARMLQDTGYIARTKAMLAAQDSLYDRAYQAYRSSDFATVRRAYQSMLRDHPTATLMPKFAFLDAMAIGKTGTQAQMSQALQNIVKSYPAADVTAMAKDILAMIGQGQQAKQGTNDTGIEELRQEAEKPEELPELKEFTRNDTSAHALVILLSNTSRRQAFATLYDIAAYNFTRFMVNTYDLEVRQIDGIYSIIVTEFESRQQAEWYHKKLTDESAIQGTGYVIISIDDLGIIGKAKTLDNYLHPVKAKTPDPQTSKPLKPKNNQINKPKK